MKKNKTPIFLMCHLLFPLLLCQGCAGGYDKFSASVITSAFLGFFLGIGIIYGIHELFNVEKVRKWLSALSFSVKILCFILGPIAAVIIIIGFRSDGLLFYNTFLGSILLFISNRLYQSAKCWQSGNWDKAKLNSKLVVFSIGIFVTIMFLIYFGRNVLDF